MDATGRRILVLGGAGYLGTALTGRLREAGATVIRADVSPGPDVIDCDVTDGADVERVVASQEPDLVVNLAYLLGQPTEADPGRALAVNCVGMQHVLDAAGAAGVDRLVYASSIAVYGLPAAHDGPIAEDATPPAAYRQYPAMLYSATKQLNEYQARLAADRQGLDVAAVRPSLVFGPGHESGPHAVWTEFAAAPARGEAVTIPHRPDQRLGLVHRDDVADLFARVTLADRLAHHAYNTGGHVVTVRELADRIERLFPGTVNADPDAEPVALVADVANERARRAFDYELTPLDAALRDTAGVDG
jgi:nucleoside-diphosphate-sugar epimerase